MGGGVGDVDDGRLDELFQPLLAVFAESGLDHGVVGLVVCEDPVHDGDGGEVAFHVPLARVCAEEGSEADDFGSGRRRGRGSLADRLGHRLGRVDVDD